MILGLCLSTRCVQFPASFVCDCFFFYVSLFDILEVCEWATAGKACAM